MTQGGAISVETRINDRIRVPEVRLVGPNGEQVGIVRIEDALRLAVEADLDLVEVAPMAKPPVCKLMDFGKFKYEAALKERESRKNQTHTIIKEMKLRPKIDQHDYETKKGHVERFLRQATRSRSPACSAVGSRVDRSWGFDCSPVSPKTWRSWGTWRRIRSRMVETC